MPAENYLIMTLPSRPKETEFWQDPREELTGFGRPPTLSLYPPYIGVPPLDAANARIWVLAPMLLLGRKPQATPRGSLVRYAADPAVPPIEVCPPPAVLHAACVRVMHNLQYQRGKPLPHVRNRALEALPWIRANAAEIPLAPGHFDSAAAAVAWIESLYAAGAIRVEVADIRIVSATEDYARRLIVSLPHAPAAATALTGLLNREVRAGGCQVEPEPSARGFSLWWN